MKNKENEKMQERHYMHYFKEQTEQNITFTALQFHILCLLVLQVETGRKQTKNLTYIDSPNHTLHSDLHVPYVRTVFQERTTNHRTALDSHPNPLIEPLVHPPDKRRLKRRWTFDEIH
jgi:hypothetical protein